MADIVGIQTIMARALPQGVDGARVAQWQLRSGKTFQQWVAQAAQAITGFNAELQQNWGWLFTIVTDPMMEYANGQAVEEAAEISDVDVIDAVRGTTIGHMIDLRAYGVAIGGSRRFMRDAREAQFDAQLRAAVNQLRWRWERMLLRRWFTNTEYPVGVGGYDVPFVRGAGGAVDYVPPAFGGQVFDANHNHYIALDSSSKNLGDALDALAETIQEHGHEPPYIAMVSRADAATYRSLVNFVEPLGNTPIVIVDQGGLTSGIPRFFSRDAREFGVLGGYNSPFGYVELRATNRIPSGYVGMVKSYGVNDARNPLAVRVHPDIGFGATLVSETTSDVMYPLKQINVEFEFGVSVGRDRTNGAVAYVVSGGVWSNPTIA